VVREDPVGQAAAAADLVLPRTLEGLLRSVDVLNAKFLALANTPEITRATVRLAVARIWSEHLGPASAAYFRANHNLHDADLAPWVHTQIPQASPAVFSACLSKVCTLFWRGRYNFRERVHHVAAVHFRGLHLTALQVAAIKQSPQALLRFSNEILARVRRHEVLTAFESNRTLELVTAWLDFVPIPAPAAPAPQPLSDAPGSA